MSVRRVRDRVFDPRWLVVGIGVGVGLQLLAWVTGAGLFGGLPSYFLMGAIVGWFSPGNTVVEPGVAAFVIAGTGFVLDHLVLSVLGAGVVLGALYGLVGLLFGVAGGWVGERL